MLIISIKQRRHDIQTLKEPHSSRKPIIFTLVAPSWHPPGPVNHLFWDLLQFCDTCKKFWFIAQTVTEQKLRLTKVDNVKYFKRFVIRDCAEQFSIVTSSNVLYVTCNHTVQYHTIQCSNEMSTFSELPLSASVNMFNYYWVLPTTIFHY